MVVGVILFFVFSAIAIAAIVAGIHFNDDDRPTAAAMSYIAAVLCVIAILIVPFSFHTVDTGEIAVVKHFGEARGTRSAGMHYDFWMTNSYQVYDTKVQNVDIETMAYSSDAQTMDIQMTIQYQIMADKVIDIAKQYGSLELLQNRIQSVAVEKTKAVLSAHKAMDIIAQRADMSPAVETSIKNAVGDEYFVNVSTVVLTNIDFSDAFETAVEEKMIAEQQQLKAQYENQQKVAQAEADAQVRVVSANADAEAKLVAANAEAEAKLISAKAESEANKLLDQSLTEKVLREMYIKKWNGSMPEVVAGSESSGIMIQTQSDK